MVFNPIPTPHPMSGSREMLDRFEQFVEGGMPDHALEIYPACLALVCRLIFNLCLNYIIFERCSISGKAVVGTHDGEPSNDPTGSKPITISDLHRKIEDSRHNRVPLLGSE
jgi:hypothetical protein